MVLPDRRSGCGDEGAGEVLSYALVRRETERCERLRGGSAKRRRGRISGKDGRGEFRIEASNVAGEFGKREVYGLMDMAHTIA